MVKYFRFFLLVTFVSFVTIVYYSSIFLPRLFYSSSSPSVDETMAGDITGTNSIINNVNDSQLILLTWTQRWGRKYPLDGLDICQSSITRSCVMVDDRTLLDKSAAVIFHVRDIHYSDLPISKPLNTQFVFFTHESPEMTFLPLKGLPVGYFDYTMTYRLDSHVYCPYGYLEKTTAPIDKKWKKYAANKTKLIAWFVSNCQTDSYREHYVYELQRYIKVDVYGDCGEFRCPKDTKEACDEYLRSTYKFYLSLENAACKDYISEKFFYRLNDYVVPIVLRRSDYEKVSPNMSFIALDDFKSPKDLAKYLLHLNTNHDEYVKYFEWRNRFDVITDKMTKYCYCDLCERLWQERDFLNRARKPLSSQAQLPSKAQSIAKKEEPLDIDRWWYVDGACEHKYAYKLLKKKSDS